MIIQGGGQGFENPENDLYTGVIVDVIDLGLLPKTYLGKTTMVPKTRIVWLLDKNDKSGRPFQVQQTFTASVSETSHFFKAVKQILGHAPSAPYDADELIGISRKLFIVREKSKDGAKEFANIQGIAPLGAKDAPLAIPAGYIRDNGQAKAKAAAKMQGQGQTQTQTTAAPAAAATAALAQATAAAAVAADEDVAF